MSTGMKIVRVVIEVMILAVIIWGLEFAAVYKYGGF